MKTGINLLRPPAWTIEDMMAAARDALFTHVCLPCDLAMEIALGGGRARDQFQTLLAENGLKVDWIHVPFRETHFYHPHEEYRLHALATAKSVLDLARALEAGSMVCHPISTPYPDMAAGDSPGDIRTRLRQVFTVLMEEAHASGVRVTVENLRLPASHRILGQLLEDVPELGLCLDTGHCELTRSHHLWGLAGRIECLHLADNFGWEDDHLPPGDGAIDFPAIVKKLKKACYDGVWSLEIDVANTGREWRPADFYRHARDNLRDMMSSTE